MRSLLSFMLFFLTGISAVGQLYIVEGSDTVLLSQQQIDSSQAALYLRDYSLQMIEKGHIFFNLGEFTTQDSSTYIKVSSGDKYQWKKMYLITSEDTTKIKRDRLRKQLDQTLRRFTNSGYPFAQLKLIAINKQKTDLDSYWRVFPGPFITYDSLDIEKGKSFNIKYLQNVLEVKVNHVYQEKDVNLISKRIAQVPFYNLSSYPRLSFSGKKAKISLDLSERKINSFEGVVGVLPATEANSQATITGYLNLSLSNIGFSGKELHLNWQRFSVQSQEVSLRFVYPYLFNSPIGIEGSLDLLKQDSSFTNNKFGARVFTRLAGNQKVNFGYQADLNNVQNPTPRRNLVSSTVNWYQLEVSSISNDSFSNTRFLDYVASGSLGRRTIRSSQVDSVERISNTFFGHFSIVGQQPISNSLAVYGKLGGAMKRNEVLFENELLRLGGFKTLRGFNELQFFLSEYVYSNLELRYFFENRSYLFLLNDLAFLKSGLETSLQTPWHYSIGFGLSIKNKNGLFSIIFANGSQFSQNVSITDTKVHFGYTSTF